MFIGSINAHTRKYLIAQVGVFAGRRVVVGCSGNFTFEALLARYGQPAAVHSNDVSLYSCTLGRLLAGDPVALAIKDGYAWLRPFCQTREDRAATILALSGMLAYLSGSPNAYKQRIAAGYREQWERVHAETKAKMLAIAEGIRIDEFYAGDVVEHYRRFADDNNTVFVAFAPTYTGGYEKLYEVYDEIVAWDAPQYGLLDDEARERLLAWMQARDYVWVDDRELGFEPVFAARVGRMRTQYVYTNVVGQVGHTRRHRAITDPGYELVEEIRPQSALTIRPVSGDVFAFYQEAYLSKGVGAPAAPSWAYLVLVDGRVAGAVGFSAERFSRGSDWVYMLSDFAIWPTPYRRLSKLVLMAATSRDVQLMLERQRVAATRCLTTTAFTDQPVSMKYRGVLELLKRGEGYLQYGGEFSELSLNEVMSEWWTRYGTLLRS